MKANVGGLDRWLRIMVGLALIFAGIFLFKGTAGYVSIIVGIIPLITGLVGYCPLYRLFGWSTCKVR